MSADPCFTRLETTALFQSAPKAKQTGAGLPRRRQARPFPGHLGRPGAKETRGREGPPAPDLAEAPRPGAADPGQLAARLGSARPPPASPAPTRANHPPNAVPTQLGPSSAAETRRKPTSGPRRVRLHTPPPLQGNRATTVRIRHPPDFRFRQATHRRARQISRYLGRRVGRSRSFSGGGAKVGARPACRPPGRWTPTWHPCRSRPRILVPLEWEPVTRGDGSPGNLQRREGKAASGRLPPRGSAEDARQARPRRGERAGNLSGAAPRPPAGRASAGRGPHSVSNVFSPNTPLPPPAAGASARLPPPGCPRVPRPRPLPPSAGAYKLHIPN
ncbi:translation initiation factor IF-2-like [Phyllostomus discolor]|uniref:Translation initiation factor IF-2-like n=1 Tax=Phyllostomus discolor TaxID=89673 RepID=A0A7E6CRG5_9CHIR|nr:translation initiation factor IF-2-like [Phyllostomus discolor]